MYKKYFQYNFRFLFQVFLVLRDAILVGFQMGVLSRTT